jgi:phospho-N-acetylmuramoyl-pentapeptide-transferase
LWSDPSNPFVWVTVFSTLAFGAIGFADDYIKVVQRRSLGLTARAKLLWQGLAGAAGGHGAGGAGAVQDVLHALSVPFIKSLAPRPAVALAGPHASRIWAAGLCALRASGSSSCWWVRPTRST